MLRRGPIEVTCKSVTDVTDVLRSLVTVASGGTGRHEHAKHEKGGAPYSPFSHGNFTVLGRDSNSGMVADGQHTSEVDNTLEVVTSMRMKRE